MAVINWLILLAVSEKLSYNFLNLKGDYVWSHTLGDDNKNIFQHFHIHIKFLTRFKLNLHEVKKTFSSFHLHKSL